ncbi:MAG: DMT family transporter [Desulfobacteraceae bacterium]|nr:DMT family transporter [Desulfobacteraceae bacterium]
MSDDLKGAVSIIFAGFCFALMGTAIKKLSLTMPNEIIVFSRNLFVLICFIPFLMRKKNLINLKTKNFRLHIARSLSGLSAMYLYFYTLSKLPLAEAVMLSYTSPIFIPFVAFLWIKEPIERKYIISAFGGFTGILMILKPGTSIFNYNGIYGIVAAVCASVAMVAIRRMSKTESPFKIVFFYTLISSIISFLPLTGKNIIPDNNEMILIFVMGLSGLAGQFFVTTGYSIAPSAKVGPFTYTTVFFAAIIGVFFLNETFDIYSMTGGVLIACAGILSVSNIKI